MALVVQIGKRRWLAGMTWSSFEDAPNKDELREDARRLGASWVSVRIGEAAIQAGFCTPVENIKQPAKLFSLAAMLADSREQPWLGIFKIAENLWWYVAVRDGHAILPDGDVIGGEDAIYAARERHSGYTDWKYVEGDLTLLEELIKSIDARPTKVRALNGEHRALIPYAVAIAILGCSAGGGYMWWKQKQAAEEEARVVAMARMRAQLAAGKPIELTPSPLLSTPAANDWMDACGDAILNLPLSFNGWTPDQIDCNASAAVVKWVRKDGATVAHRPAGELMPDGEAVVQNIALVGLPSQGPDNATDMREAQLAMRAWAQAAKFSLVIKNPTVAPPLPGAPVEVAPAVQRPQIGVSLDTLVSPFNLDYSSIPGLRLSTLKSTEQGWHIEGVLYGR